MKNIVVKGGWNDEDDYEAHLPFTGQFLGVLDDGDHFELSGMVFGIIRRDGQPLNLGMRVRIVEPKEIRGRVAEVWFQRNGDFPGLIQIQEDE